MTDGNISKISIIRKQKYESADVCRLVYTGNALSLGNPGHFKGYFAHGTF